MFRRMTLLWKLISLMGIPLVAMVLSSAVTIQHLNTISDDLVQELYQQDYVTLNYIGLAQEEMYAALLAEHTLLYTEPQNPRFAPLMQSIHEHVQKAEAHVEVARNLALADKAEWERIKHPQTKRTIFQNFDDFDSNFRTWAQVSGTMIEKLSQQSLSDRQEAYGKTDEVDYTFQASIASMAETKEILESIAANAIVQKESGKQSAIRTIYLTIGIVLVLMTLFATLLVQNIRRSLRQSLAVTQRVAQGDLRTLQMPKLGRDELGQFAVAVHSMVGNLRGLIEQVNRSAEQVATSAGRMTSHAEGMQASTTQIARELEQLAQGTDVQAESADQISKAMDEMGQSIQRVADTSSLVTQAARETAHVVDAGQDSIQQAVLQMHAISAVADRSADKVRQLGQHSTAIAHIVGVITSIARQTNLLALNASIEAARAGEQGRGFAVVAEEVRKLAEQSQESAHQIQDLIKKIEVDTGDTVQTMDEVIREVQTGMVAVDVAGTAFQHILTKTHTVAEQIREITAASEVMSTASLQASASAEESATISHQTASRSQNCAATVEQQVAAMEDLYNLSEGLNQLAHELEDVLSRFEM